MHPLADKILRLELAEVGYIEQGTNLTKYARELDATEHPRIGREGAPWCGTFQDYNFWKAGAIPALAFRNFGTVAAARAYMRLGRWYADPQPGDLAFLHNTGATGHVGFVEAIGTGGVITVEGNTSAGVNGDQRNGGMVARRFRPIKFWAGFGRPDYDAVPMAATVDWAAVAALVASFRKQVLLLGSKGPAVAFLQRILGVPDDGDFGPRTKAALVERQKAFVKHQMTDLHIPEGSPFLLVVTGVCEDHTWAALLDVA